MKNIIKNADKATFKLDERLKNDSIEIASLALCDLRLINDARWPWLVLVPRIAGAEEIHHVDLAQQAIILAEINKVALALEALTACDKVNIAALGNIVRQLHIHIIARNIGDENWPNAVFGYGKKQPYLEKDAQSFIEIIKKDWIK